MKLLPLGTRYLLKKSEVPKSDTGLVVPNSVEQKTFECIIEAKGDQTLDSRLIPGIKVLVPKLAGIPIKINNEEYSIVYEHEILGILEK